MTTLLGSTGMQAIASLPSLESLSIVVDDSLCTLPYIITPVHPIASLQIVLQRSFVFGESHNNGLGSALSLLHAFSIPFHQLTITLPVHFGGVALTDFIASLAQDFNISNHSKFSVMALRHLAVHTGIDRTDNSTLLPSYCLEPPYGILITHIDLGCFSMCNLDDDTLYTLSSTFPSLESLFLGVHSYLSDPPRASLAGLSAVLHNCRGLKELGLVFSCSVGALDFSLLPVNSSITTLHVGVSPSYNPSVVSAFLARALPCLEKICIETYYKSSSTLHNYVASDHLH
ncbi:hypothetical protein DFH29DRAFT_1009250 [Suillus ampliporus]|nr:hypothetical protein DFH29DRAFT_1009250 [Suillus ampliporus]